MDVHASSSKNVKSAPPVAQKKMRLFARFRKSQDGAAAIEFAMVAVPFFAMLFAIIETALVLFAGQLMETSVFNAGRLIMTGQAQKQSWSGQQFKAKLCQELTGMFNCDNVHIDVRNYDNLYEAAAGDGYSNYHFWIGGGDAELSTSGFQYSPGTPGKIVIVRGYYQWPVFVTGLGYNLANQSNNRFLLVGTYVFKNEPYD